MFFLKTGHHNDFPVIFRLKHDFDPIPVNLIGKAFHKANSLENIFKALERELGMGPNCSYRDWQVFGVIVFGYLCGYKRLAHFEEFSKDTTVQKLLGLEGPIDENTLARRVKQAGYKQSVELSRVSQALAVRVHRHYEGLEEDPRLVDFDSTVKGVYGCQQRAAKGFNPTRKGQKILSSAAGF